MGAWCMQLARGDRTKKERMPSVPTFAVSPSQTGLRGRVLAKHEWTTKPGFIKRENVLRLEVVGVDGDRT